MDTSPHRARRLGPTPHADHFGVIELLNFLRWCAARLVIHGADVRPRP